MNDAILDVAATCLDTSLRDEAWQDIGFSKRPKYGAFFQRFRAKWKVDLEKSILQEMIILFTAAHLLACRIRDSDIDDLVSLYTDGYGSVTDLFRTLGYATKSEAAAHLRSSIREYARSDTSEWASRLLQRLDVKNIPDEKLAASLMVGAMRFASNVVGMTRFL